MPALDPATQITHCPNDGVAGRMAAGVVDRFEIVQVEQDQRQRSPMTPTPRQLAVGLFEKVATTGMPLSASKFDR